MSFVYSSRKKSIAVAICVAFSVQYFSAVPTAYATSEDLDSIIRSQQEVLLQLNDKKMQSLKEDYAKQLRSLEQSQGDLKGQMEELKRQIQSASSTSAITDLSSRIGAIERQISSQVQSQQKLLDAISSLKEMQVDAAPVGVGTNRFLSNPDPSPSATVQDAINAQKNAEMRFAYSPSGLYKIYCKVGYLTDIRFKEGETITFVGGGDTGQWTIESAETGASAKTAHLYIKPNSANCTTNLIINTSQHTYQIIAVSSEWYNPMISWSYGAEEQLAGKIKKAQDESFYTESNLNLSNPESLNFNYRIKKNGADWEPTMVFDDGKKTFIKFSSSPRQTQMPVLFIKEKGKKDLSLVNYRIKDNFYIVDRLFTQAELRVSEKESVKIIAEK